MSSAETWSSALRAAYPVIIGYVGIGIPCGIMEAHIGMNALMAFAMSMTFYSGAGQFMIPSMWIAGNPIASIIASVSFVNTRQLLYSAAFSPFFNTVGKGLTFLFSATVTDESFGINLSKFQEGDWSASQATCVNLLCMASWGISNSVGVLVGSALEIPTSIAAFAMTSIFICLLASQMKSQENVFAAIAAIIFVCLFKFLGLGGAAILLAAVCGVFAGMAFKVVLSR